MKAGELNQTMRLDIVGLKDMRSALFHNIPECANDMTVEGAPLADHLAGDSNLAGRGDELARGRIAGIPAAGPVAGGPVADWDSR
jgi:hypothetical protein